MQDKSKITGWQFCFFIIQTQIGVAILSMPTDVSKLAKQDAWIAMTLAGIAVQIVIFIYYILLTRVKADSFQLALEEITGKWLGITLSIGYLGYFLFVLVLSLASFNRILSTWVYSDTPAWVIMLLYIIPAAYMARENVALIARFHMMVSLLIPILLFILLWVYTEPEFLYLLPVGGAGMENIIMAIKPALFALIGFEAYLIIGFYVSQKRTAELKKGMTGSLFVTVFYVFVIITTQIFFFVDELKVVPYPVLYIMKAISFTIVERIDLIFLMIWMAVASASFISYLFIASTTLNHVIKRKNHTWAVYLILATVYVIALIPNTKYQLDSWREALLTITPFFVIYIPFFLVLLLRIRQWGSGGGSK